MKRRIFPRPKPGPMTLEAVSKDGITTFHLNFDNRRFGVVIYNQKLTPQAAIIALDAFARTLRREFLSGQAHK